MATMLIRTKLLISSLFLAALIVGGTLFAYWQLRHVYEDARAAGNDMLPVAAAIGQIQYKVTLGRSWFEEYMSGDETRAPEEAYALFDESLATCRSMLNGGRVDQLELVSVKDSLLRARISSLETGIGLLLRSAQIRNEQRGSPGAGHALKEDFDLLYGVLMEDARVVSDEATDVSATLLKNMQSTYGHAIFLTFTGAVVLLVFAVTVSWMFGLSISKPLEQIVQVSEQVSQGHVDVRVRLDRRDEIGTLATSFNLAFHKLRELLREIQTTSSHIAITTVETNATLKQLAATSQLQSDRSREITDSLHRMSLDMKTTSETAHTTNEQVQRTGQIAQEGQAMLSTALNKIKDIAASTQETSDLMTQLKHASDKIADIVKVIESIAGQTKLLALNSSIQADRAGIQGKGFAVVSNEIRALAEKTDGAIKQIPVIVENIQHLTQRVLQTTESTLDKANEGMVLSDQARDALTAIMNAIHDNMEHINHVARAVEHMMTVSEEVSLNMEQIAIGVTQSSTGANEIANATDQLRRAAEDMQAKAGWFKTEGTQDKHHSMA